MILIISAVAEFSTAVCPLTFHTHNASYEIKSAGKEFIETATGFLNFIAIGWDGPREYLLKHPAHDHHFTLLEREKEKFSNVTWSGENYVDNLYLISSCLLRAKKIFLKQMADISKTKKIRVKCLFYINIDTDGDITQQT